jgi:plasmid stability protein
MGQVIIRNLDDAVIERHRLRAKARGVSLEQELRDVLSSTGDKAEFALEAARIRAANLPPPAGARWPTAEEMIRDDRDSR